MQLLKLVCQVNTIETKHKTHSWAYLEQETINIQFTSLINIDLSLIYILMKFSCFMCISQMLLFCKC